MLGNHQFAPGCCSFLASINLVERDGGGQHNLPQCSFFVETSPTRYSDYVVHIRGIGQVYMPLRLLITRLYETDVSNSCWTLSLASAMPSKEKSSTLSRQLGRRIQLKLTAIGNTQGGGEYKNSKSDVVFYRPMAQKAGKTSRRQPTPGLERQQKRWLTGMPGIPVVNKEYPVTISLETPP